MPRVSDEHLARRRQQILDAAWECFARNGFHSTSMQDIFKEADLSAGAVYRYFKSKDEIIAAIAQESQGYAMAYLDGVLAMETLPPLPEIMGSFCDHLMQRLCASGKLRIVPQAWAEAMRGGDLSESLRSLFGSMRQRWEALAARLQKEGRLAEQADPHAVGVMLVCMMPGFILQQLMLGDLKPGVIQEAFEGILASPADC